MSMTRRETLKVLASVSAVAGLGETARAAPRSSPVPIVTPGGTRLYLTSIFPNGAPEPIPNLTWSLPAIDDEPSAGVRHERLRCLRRADQP